MITASKDQTIAIVGKNLRRLIESREGLTQTKLAKDAGVCYSTVTDTCNLRSVPSVKVLGVLAKTLGCSMADLFKEE